ncbi:hypothetical protein [Vogesella indigofera]|nr:hypothetical protein [Vogesella indigofera]MDC7708354.1 hypothetical protein [Vogesella indigofera]
MTRAAPAAARLGRTPDGLVSRARPSRVSSGYARQKQLAVAAASQ